NGTDPSPTLAQFQLWVSQGKIHYFLASGQGMRGGFGGGGFGGGGFGGGGFGPGGFGPGGSDGRGTSTSIASWVESHFTATTVGGVTVYDLTTATSTTGTTA
ncbi:MAG: glycosyl transferase, partial [Actinomycetes bacterium]